MSPSESPYRRTRRTGQRRQDRPIIRVPVKRIGRDTKRCYCEVCGQKRAACVCPTGSGREAQ